MGCNGCDSCSDDCGPGGPLSDRGSGENLIEPIHHDCCWFARRQNRIEYCQKRNIEFIEDIHGNLSEGCRDCPHYAYLK